MSHITVEPTGEFLWIDGVKVRRWKGLTFHGEARIDLYVVGVRVPTEDTAVFEEEFPMLKSIPPADADGQLPSVTREPQALGWGEEHAPGRLYRDGE